MSLPQGGILSPGVASRSPAYLSHSAPDVSISVHTTRVLIKYNNVLPTPTPLGFIPECIPKFKHLVINIYSVNQLRIICQPI